MNKSMQQLAAAAMIAASALAFTATPAYAQNEGQVLVDKADTTLSNFLRDPEMKWLQQNIGKARGVLIVPEIVKAGFIIGGSGGRGLLVAKEGGKWVGPAFYTLATASVGFQAGVAASENVTLVMTQKGMDSLLSSTFKMGADASVAAGPVGAGAKSDVVADLNSDMVGRNSKDTVAVIGREHSNLGTTLDSVAAAHHELNIKPVGDLWPQEGLYFRSDHYNFAKKGVPILFFTTGLHPDYHKVSDSPDKIDAEKESRILKLLLYVGAEVANAPRRPKWTPESYKQIVGGER